MRCGITNIVVVGVCIRYLDDLFGLLLTGNSSTVVITGAGITGGS